MTETAYRCEIYRDAEGYDCTLRGVSSRFTRAMLYRKGYEPETPPEGYAILVLEDSPRAGPEPYLRAAPAGEKRWTMFGGNFIWSSDSRFRNEVSGRPIPVHDRIEE